MRYVAGTIDYELLEVPCDIGGVGVAGLRRLEQPVQLTRTVAVDLDLREHRKVDVVLRRDELENLGLGTGLLRSELIARKSKYLSVVELMMKRTQTCVLGRKASKAGDIDDDEHLTAKLAEVDLLAGDARHLEIVYR